MGNRGREPAPTGGGARRVRALDGFRAYAILGVVTVHLLGASGVLAATAGTGTAVALWLPLGNTIDAFFIISAFVLFLPVVRRGGAFGSKARFWIDRGVRLFPAYWLALTAGLLLLAIGPRAASMQMPSFGDVAAHLAVLQMPMTLLDSDFRIGFGTNGPLWLLSIVIAFYLLLPFVAGRYHRHPLVGLALAAALTIAWKQTVDWAPQIFTALTIRSDDVVAGLAVDQFPGWAFSFGVGMTAAWAYERVNDRIPRDRLEAIAVPGFLVAVPAYGLAAYLYARVALTHGGNIGLIARQDTFAAMLQTALRGAVIFAVICGPLWLRLPFANRITDRLAELSYGVYLFHWLLVIYLSSFTGLPRSGTLLDFLIWVAVIVPPSLALAALSRRWVELPIAASVRRRLDASPRLRRPIPADVPPASAS